MLDNQIKLAVIIVNYKTAKLVMQCLEVFIEAI